MGDDSMLDEESQGVEGPEKTKREEKIENEKADLLARIGSSEIATMRHRVAWILNRFPSTLRWLRLFGQNLSVLKWRLAVFCLRGSVPCGQVVKVHAIRRPPVKSPMGSRLVIESQVAS